MPQAPLQELSALVLAAGRGQRMRPLTDHIPKPLLQVRGKSLLLHRLEALALGGCKSAVINTAWLGEQIESALGPQLQFSHAGDTLAAAVQTYTLPLAYSREGQDFGHALETAGGVSRALPLLGAAFWVCASDIFTPGFSFSQSAVQRFLASDHLAHLWLVPNPEHHPDGDFGWDSSSALAHNLPKDATQARWTYSGIGLFRRDLFLPPWCTIPPGNPEGTVLALGGLLRSAMDQGRVSAELYRGAWTDVGSPQRLQELQQI